MPAIDSLLALLNLEGRGDNFFRGASRDQGFKQVFGGQVIAQALVAAGRTVGSERAVHSLHAYFLRPGDVRLPIDYEVDCVRDGGSFTTRRVQAFQQQQAIFTMMASFHILEPGWNHQAPAPSVPPAETLKSGGELYREWLRSGAIGSPGLLGLQATAEQAGIEFRPVVVPDSGAGAPPHSQTLWFRSAGALPTGHLVQACVLAYASDFNLLGTAKLPHGGHFGQNDMMTASVDHAIWFHRDFRVEDWLCYCMDTPNAHGARGFVRGQVFDQRGRLVASVAQEGLMRHLSHPR